MCIFKNEKGRSSCESDGVKEKSLLKEQLSKGDEKDSDSEYSQ